MLKKKKKIDSSNLWFITTSILCLVVMILIFLIIGTGINNTKVYSFSGSGEYLNFKNGLAIKSRKFNIIKLSDLKEGDYIAPIKSLSISIITDNYEVYNVTNTDNNGFYMSDILDDISINVQSNNKNTFNEETYVKITITTIDNLKLEEKIVIDSYKF